MLPMYTCCRGAETDVVEIADDMSDDMHTGGSGQVPYMAEFGAVFRGSGQAPLSGALTTMKTELQCLQSLVEQLDEKVSAEVKLRQALEKSFEERLRNTDRIWYSAEEFRAWREGIEVQHSDMKLSMEEEVMRRNCFETQQQGSISGLKQELKDTISKELNECRWHLQELRDEQGGKETDLSHKKLKLELSEEVEKVRHSLSDEFRDMMTSTATAMANSERQWKAADDINCNMFLAFEQRLEEHSRDTSITLKAETQARASMSEILDEAVVSVSDLKTSAKGQFDLVQEIRDRDLSAVSLQIQDLCRVILELSLQIQDLRRNKDRSQKTNGAANESLVPGVRGECQRRPAGMLAKLADWSCCPFLDARNSRNLRAD